MWKDNENKGEEEKYLHLCESIVKPAIDAQYASLRCTTSLGCAKRLMDAQMCLLTDNEDDNFFNKPLLVYNLKVNTINTYLICFL